MNFPGEQMDSSDITKIKNVTLIGNDTEGDEDLNL